MKDLFMKFTKEQLQDYKKRLQNYRISREFFESLYREGIIEEIDFYEYEHNTSGYEGKLFDYLRDKGVTIEEKPQ